MYRARMSITIVIFVFFATLVLCSVASLELSQAQPLSKPLIVYYSLTGTTRIIAQELARNLSCALEEIVSRKNRHFFWKITCVHDQLFDRDDDMEPVKKDLSGYSQLIVASPIWIHRLSSPVRTFLKYSGLKGKTVWLVLTNNGNFDTNDQNHIIEFVESLGITVEGCHCVCTKGKSESELWQHARSLIKEITFSDHT